MRPRITQAEFNLPPPKAPSYGLIPTRRTHHLTKHVNSRPFLLMPYGEAYTQSPNLPKLTGQVGFAGDPLPREQRLEDESASLVEGAWSDPMDASYLLGFPPPASDPVPRSNAAKKLRQWARWQDEVIPRLLTPYLELLAETRSLSNLNDITLPLCTCGGRPRTVNAAVVSFTGDELARA